MPTQFVRHKTELNHAGLIVGQCGIAACFEGDPGVGKTMTIASLALTTSRLFFSYELSRTQPEDLGGFPIVDELNFQGQPYKYMRFVPDERLLRAELELSVLLLDEVNNVGPAKQAPALNLIQKGLRNAWMFMACNPPENAADGHPLTCPFINRIWYGKWEIDNEAIFEGYRHKCVYPAPDVPIVPPNYMDYQPRWGALACDYLRHKPSDHNACPKKQAEKHLPWPSARSWENCLRALAAADAVGSSDRIQQQIMSGFLGERVSQSFLAHIASLSLPDPEDILANAGTFEFPARYDVLVSILESVVNHLRELQDQHTFDRCITLYERLKRKNSEMAELFMGGLRMVMPDHVHAYDIHCLVKTGV